MKIALSEKQLRLITSMTEADGDTSASSGTDTTTSSAASSSQSSGTQSSKAGYPAVDKWESGITRGPANPIGVAKWSDVVGAKLTRGHANPLNEQPTGTIKTNYPKLYGNDYVNYSKNDNIPKILPQLQLNLNAARAPKGSTRRAYPSCITSENSNLYTIAKDAYGKYYAVPNQPKFEGYRFYPDLTVFCPDGKYRKYACNQGGYEPLIDGKEVIDYKWLKEKDKWVTDYERNELKKIEYQQAQMAKLGDFYQKYHHDINMVVGIAAVFIPFVGPALSAGIGAIDAKQYYDEGDTKTAGMIMMFALLPGIGKVVSKIPGVKTFGPKLMAELGKKISLGSKAISPAEIEVVTKISQYKNLITQEITKVGEAAAKQNVKKQLVKQAVKQKVKQKAAALGKTAALYTGAGVAYHKGYDKIVGKPKAQDYVDRVTHSTEKPVIYKEEDMEQDENGNWVPKQ